MEEIINTYEKLSVGKYMELMEVVTDTEADEYDKNLAIVSILTNIDTVELYNMPIGRFNHLLQNSSFLTESPKKNEIEDKYIVGEYTLIPQYSIGAMTTAQFIDYQTYVKEPDKNLCQILAVFLIPEGHIYNDGYDLDDVVKSIKDHLCICDALTLSAFFLLQFRALLKATLTSFKRKLKKMKKNKTMKKEDIEKIEQKIQALEESGVGLRWSTK